MSGFFNNPNEPKPEKKDFAPAVLTKAAEGLWAILERNKFPGLWRH